MVRFRRGRGQAGFTLIEMLCTIAIILVLAGLVLGPASRVLRKVRADQWGERSSTRLHDAVEQLRKHLAGQSAFGIVTLERIETSRWVGPLEADFLRDRRVTFIPFADSDPDEKVVIRVQVDRGYWTDAEVRTLRKADLTSPPQ